jgi:hypothetical protein
LTGEVQPSAFAIPERLKRDLTEKAWTHGKRNEKFFKIFK